MDNANVEKVSRILVESVYNSSAWSILGQD